MASELEILTLDDIYSKYKSRVFTSSELHIFDPLKLHIEYNKILTELISYHGIDTNILKQCYMRLYVLSYLLYGSHTDTIMRIVYVQQVIFWFKMLNIEKETYNSQHVTPINNETMYVVVMDSFMIPTYEDNILRIMDRQQKGIKEVSDVIELLIDHANITSPKTRLLPKCFTLRTGFDPNPFVTYSPDETRRRCIIRRFLSDVLQNDYGIKCAKYSVRRYDTTCTQNPAVKSTADDADAGAAGAATVPDVDDEYVKLKQNHDADNFIRVLKVLNDGKVLVDRTPKTPQEIHTEYNELVSNLPNISELVEKIFYPYQPYDKGLQLWTKCFELNESWFTFLMCIYVAITPDDERIQQPIVDTTDTSVVAAVGGKSSRRRKAYKTTRRINKHKNKKQYRRKRHTKRCKKSHRRRRSRR